MHRRISLLIAAVAVLCLAIAVPTASAGKKTDRAQNKAIKKGAKAIKKNSSSIKKGSKDVKALKGSAAAATGAINALKIVAARADKNGADFAAAAPAVIQGLTDLKNGLVAAGAGLTALQTLATSQEYGYAQVTTVTAVGPPAVVAPEQGSFVVTPDIPDALNQSQTTQQFVAQNTGTLTVLYGVRSNETDGSVADPAAYCKVTVNQGANTQTTPAGPAEVGTLPFQPVTAKSALTAAPGATQNPFGLRTGAANSPDVPNTLNTAIAVTAGQTYSVGLSCVDISPSPTDPSA